jgi:hypothetical protein
MQGDEGIDAAHHLGEEQRSRAEVRVPPSLELA